MTTPYLLEYELTLLKCLHAFKRMNVKSRFATTPRNQLAYMIKREWVSFDGNYYTLTEKGEETLRNHIMMPTPESNSSRLYRLTPEGKRKIIEATGNTPKTVCTVCHHHKKLLVDSICIECLADAGRLKVKVKTS